MAEGVAGEKQGNGLGTMVYGESLDSGLGEVTALDLRIYRVPERIQTASAER